MCMTRQRSLRFLSLKILTLKILALSWLVAIGGLLPLIGQPAVGCENQWAAGAIDQDADRQSSPKLSKAITKQLDQVVFPAIEQGQSGVFFEVFGPIASKLSDEALQAIELYAKSVGVRSPLDYLVDVKLMRLESGVDSASEQLSLKSSLIMIAGISDRVADFFQTVQDHPLMSDNIVLPKSWRETRDLFWSSHVLNNEFENYKPALRYGTTLISTIRPRLKNAGADAQQTVDDFMANSRQFMQMRRQLEESEAAGRLIRFRLSAQQLVKTADFRDRLIAAMNVQLDSEALLPYLTNTTGFMRPELREAGSVFDEVEQVLGEFNSAEADRKLLQQVSLFRSGSHWWLRGRYGRAIQANGLLKSKRALKSKSAMNALYMPRERPIPEDDFIGSSTEGVTKPHYKRRHYYTWALEYRPILTERSNGTRVTSERQTELVSTHSTGLQRRDFFY